MSEQVGSPEALHEGRFLRLMRRDIPGGWWEYVERQGIEGIVLMLAIDDNGRVPLVRQFRVPVDGHVWELPAGLCDSDEPMERVAVRELEEECGYTAHRVRHLMRGPASQGAASMILDFYLLTELEPADGVEGDEVFPITTEWVALDELEEFVMDRLARNELVDIRILAALKAVERLIRRGEIAL
ncbi:MAG: NUDIX domain-containing protein [Armatimonadia bacterium]|nr:NUDIX domain-containing protein [Armatimonadia bacterium]